MTVDGWLQIALFTVAIALLVRPLGGYMMRIFRGEPTSLGQLLGPIERGIYRIAGIDPAAEQGWLGYALALIAFNGAGIGRSTRSNVYKACCRSIPSIFLRLVPSWR